MQGIFTSQHIQQIQERLRTHGFTRKIQVGEVVTLQYVGEGATVTVELKVVALHKAGVLFQQGACRLLTKHGEV